jgi:transposase
VPRGRPLTLTPELRDRICATVSAGNYRQVAAQYHGVPLRTFHRWCQMGRKAKSGAYFDFWHALLKAERDAEIVAVKRVIDASAEDAKHMEWWLERKFPGRWGRKDRVEVTGKKGGPVELDDVNLRKLPLDELVRVHRSTLGLPPPGAEDAPDPGP